jgi:RNA polymerase sigma factor (sigma-70 family)
MGATLTIATDEQDGPLTAEELCRAHAASVCRFAALVSPSVADAEDVAQDALLRAVRSLRSYDASRGSVEAWLWRIVVNAAKDAAGRRQRLRDIAVRVGMFTPREASSIEDDVVRKLADADLHAQLRRLPLRDRTLIALRFGADLDMHEVGAAVGLRPESAARAVRRALDRLRARLEDTTR